ncbi:MAG: sterol desaturase family protein, partial [Myxococcales bacterium]|nr:sterol desaturase family protein [Myxococcales bacterium]
MNVESLVAVAAEAWPSLARQLLSPLNPSDRLYWLYLLGAALGAFWVYARGRKRGTLPAGFVRFAVPKAMYLSRSSRFDFLYGFLVRALVFVVLAPLLLSERGVADQIKALLESSFGARARGGEWTSAHLIGLSLANFIAMDFGLYAAHWLLHKVPALWEFHKLHHSAEVLTPVTVYRQHPVDDILSIAMSGALGGVVIGAAEYAHPHASMLYVAGALPIGFFLYYLFGYNLRHSHVWLSYGPRIERFLISPAQHQVHHSAAPEHIDKNLGFVFAWWDRLFGTLHVTQVDPGAPVRFGLSGEP